MIDLDGVLIKRKYICILIYIYIHTHIYINPFFPFLDMSKGECGYYRESTLTVCSPNMRSICQNETYGCMVIEV